MPPTAIRVADSPRRRLLSSVLRVSAVAASLSTILAPHAADAAPVTWTGLGPSDRWSDAGNWTPTSPVTGDDVVFSGTPLRTTNTVTGAVSIGSLTFSPTATQFGIHIGGSGSDTLALTGSGLTNVSGTAGSSTQKLFLDPGAVQDALGGTLIFRNASGINLGSAGTDPPVEINALGSTGQYGGRVMFRDSSSAGNATINVGPFAYAYFDDHASAGSASINLMGASTNTYGGQALFQGASTAGNAQIHVGPGSFNPGNVSFYDTANAGSARFTIASATSAGMNSGTVYLEGSNSAANATFLVQGAQVAAGSAAALYFRGFADGAHANIVVEGDHVAATQLPFGRGVIPGASIDFLGSASAGDATIDLQGGTVAKAQGAAMTLQGQSDRSIAKAGNAVITVESGAVAGALGATATFLNYSNAGNATIVNQGASVAGAGAGRTSFTSGLTNAGSATIVNRGGSVAGADGGTTTFNVSDNGWDGRASVANGIFENQAGTAAGAGGGMTVFISNKVTYLDTASVIYNRAATVAGASSGLTLFTGGGNAGYSTLYADGGSGAAQGGRIVFDQGGNGYLARVVLGKGSGPAAGSLDISGLETSGTAVGSIEGGGIVYLGGKTLSINESGLVASFSGTITDGGLAGGTGGGLKVGSGTVTLSGANTYTGATHVGNLYYDQGPAKLVAANTSGSATGSGPVFLDFGGSLGGSGFIAGSVTLGSQATIAPGDAATLTLRDDLTWDGGGVIRLVLGVGPADSDHLVVQTLIRGKDGPFVFDLIDAGIVFGQSYDLLDFGRLVGFAASDFTTSGLVGLFSIADGELLFRAGTGVAAVPEPGTLMLFLGGMVIAVGACRRSRRRVDASC